MKIVKKKYISFFYTDATKWLLIINIFKKREKWYIEPNSLTLHQKIYITDQSNMLNIQMPYQPFKNMHVFKLNPLLRKKNMKMYQPETKMVRSTVKVKILLPGLVVIVGAFLKVAHT